MQPEENTPTKTESTSDTLTESNIPEPLKQIRTYQGDLASALKNQNESLYSIQQKEKQRYASLGITVGEGADENGDESRKSFKFFFVGGFFLFALSAVAGYYAYTEFIKKSTPPEISLPSSRFIGVDKESKIIVDADSTRLSIFEAINNSSKDNPENSIQQILIYDKSSTSTPISVTRFFGLIRYTGSGSFLRSLKDDFMLGTVGNRRFLILKTNSFENAFGGMLSWEKNIFEDIGGIFTTRSMVNGINFSPIFKDAIYENKDSRVIFTSDENGNEKVVMMYSFFNNDTIIVTEDETVLKSIIDKLNKEKIRR